MDRFSIFALSTTAILLAGTAPISIAPAKAAFALNINFGFNTFHDRLGNQGHWVHSPIWGDVWQPRRRLVGENFQPYTNGYWEYTDEYGWYWVSNDAFDDVVYHYGRWVYDPDMRWVWIPGYTWGPGWVVWREGGGYSGWMPMPPDETFVSGSGISLGMNFGSWGTSFYGYNRWYGNRVDPGRFWIFVDNRNLASRDYRRFVVPRERTQVLITNTRNVTKYEVVNNRVVNRSVDVKVIERASGRRIAPVSARQVIKPNAIVTTVDESNRVGERERAQHPIRTDVFKGQPGGLNNNQPGNGNGRPGAENGGMGQPPNATPEGGKRDRDNNNGPGNGNERPGAENGGMQQPPNTTPEGSKHDRANNNGPGNGNERPGTATGGTQQPPNTTPEGGKRDHENNNGPGKAATGSGNTPQSGSGNEQSSTPKNDRQRDRSNASPGTGNGAGSTPSGETGSAAGTEKPNRPSHGNANPGGAMTGPSGNEPSATTPGDNTSPGSEKPKRTPHNPGGAMTGPSPSQPSTTTPGDTATPPSAPPSDRATRGPRSVITPPSGATTSPSDNSQPPAPQHSRPNPNNPPGAATPPPSGASNAQQPDNSGNEPKKKKHNPQEQTPPPPQ